MLKGLRGFQKGHPSFLKTHSIETRQKLSELAKQRPPMSKEQRTKIAETLKRKGIKPKVQYIAYGPDNYFYGKSTAGAKSPSWKGGITPENVKIRTSNASIEWRKAVFGRDNFTCKDCGQYGGALQAHHIKRFSEYPKLRFEITNGITLCKTCHKKYGTYEGSPEGEVYKG
jgi:hypothetical protein